MSLNTPSTSGQSNTPTTSTAPASGGLFGSSTAPATSGGLFGSQPKNAPSFSFPNTGTAGTSAGATSSLTPGGSLFGAAGAKPGEQKSLFGTSSSATPSSSTPLSSGGTGAGSNIFGGSTLTSSSTNAFGSKPAATSTISSNLFGTTSSALNSTAASTTPTTTAPTSNLFGQDKTAANTTNAASKPGGLFGAGSGSATPSSPSLFGGANPNTTSAAQATPAKPTLFLNSTTPAGAPPSDSSKPSSNLGLFGKSATQGGSSLFSPAQQGEKKENQANSLLGNQASSQSNPATTQSTTATSGAPSLFSNTTSMFPATKPTESSSTFGVKTANSGATEGASGSSLFGQQAPSKPAETAPSTKPSLFGNTAASTTPSGSASLFKTPGAVQMSSTSAPAPPATQTSSLFSNVNKPAAGTTATEPQQPQSSSLFSGLSKPAASSGTSEAAKPTSLFGTAPTSTPTTSTTTAPSTNMAASSSVSAPGTTAASTSATAPSSGSLLNAAKAAPSTESTAPKPAATQATTLGASTSGPTSSMARLKNKTMDEIMSRWATDLSKYQKEFKEQASQVAAWDRLLVENGEKIQKLYLNTFEAEKASREVERHLVTVESQQEELESWLDKYEVEVDNLFSKQVGTGEQLAGPDQERERTYKLAEKVTERLDEMGRDLTKMIREINEISGTVSKSSKPDDPLSQIVRVLNGHLTQLQWIDTNAAALQAKIAAAQKASSQIGNQYGGPEQDNVDSFYRSYIGRR